MRVVKGSVLDATEDFLCHQCNCVSRRSAHLATAVFSRFPHADCYSLRIAPDEPGTIRVHGSGTERIVISLFGQYYPGKPREPLDGREARLAFFESCLLEMARFGKGKSFAMPYVIGCGAAGGVREEYLERIRKFSMAVGPVTLWDNTQ